MIILSYIILAAVVIVLAVRCAHYVDLIEAMTSLSGAFIGGVILAAVTSLPELFTSLSATLFLDTPGLVLGNILGSNLFNLAVLAVLALCFLRRFAGAPIDRSHRSAAFYALLCYFVLVASVLSRREVTLLSVSLPSLLLALFYVLSIRRMSDQNDAADGAAPGRDAPSALTLRQVAVRFAAAAAGLVAASIGITFVTDRLAQGLGLGATFAGALFLGVATSLPEVSSTAALFRSGNVNAAVGNITGSNIFNFFILFLTDLTYFRGSVYVRDAQTEPLLFCGAAAAALTILFVSRNAAPPSPIRRAAEAAGIIACYLAFLLS